MDENSAQGLRGELIVVPSDVALPAVAEAPIPAELLTSIRTNQEHASALNTRLAYDSDWKAFTRWCEQHGREALPASPETVAAYISARAELRKDGSGDYLYAPSTISRWVTSINVRHQRADLVAPGTSRMVKDTLAGIRREHARPTRRMAPLLLADLRRVVANIEINSYPAGMIGHRDTAILVMGMVGAFRRSELASRLVGDVDLHSEDGLHVRLLTSKTDQEGRGSIKALPFGEDPLVCPPCVFLRWIRVLDTDATGSRPAMMRLLRDADNSTHICRAAAPELGRLNPRSALFRPVRKGGHIGVNAISGDVVYDVVKRRLAAVGMNAQRFGGHSLRAGFVTQALRSGAAPHEVMPQTGHRNPATVEIYRRETDPLRGNAVTRLPL